MADSRRKFDEDFKQIMREQQLVAGAKKRRKQTTRPGKGRWRAPDLIGRDLPATTVNQKWCGCVAASPRPGGGCASPRPVPGYQCRGGA